MPGDRNLYQTLDLGMGCSKKNDIICGTKTGTIRGKKPEIRPKQCVFDSLA